MPDIRYYMGFAEHAAKASKDSTKVGCVIVGPDGEIRVTGYNGPPKGVRDTPDRFQRPEKYLYASHAEQNAIAFAAREGIRTKDCTIYVTHPCCPSCVKSIIQAGIKCVVTGNGELQMPIELEAVIMLQEAGIKTIKENQNVE